VLTSALEAEVMARIIEPTVATLAARGTPFSGVLFLGVMLTAAGPKLIEYNCRFGDPECEVLMMRLENDLVELLLAVAQGRLADAPPIALSPQAALTIVMAARGYPGIPEKGAPISLPAAPEGARIFHAGTALREGRLVANGGRVLAVTALGRTVTQARDAAYALAEGVDFPGGFCRRDIGWREVAREAATREN
jgi:phosphoribosylamine--glycine ligase